MESFGNFNKSISYLPKLKKYSLYEAITIDNRENYYLVSSSPITKEAEDDMELLSDMVTGECYLHHWEPGIYICAQCKNALYSSKDKWRGPCVWPSFRKPYNEASMKIIIVENYNQYKCDVFELYCLNCLLFIGHQFHDSEEKGDGLHPDYTGWRH